MADNNDPAKGTKYENASPPPDVEWRPRQGSLAGGGPSGPSPGAFPFVVVPPQDGEHFTLQDEVDSAAAGIVDFTAATATIQVPNGYVGVLAEIQFFATPADATMTGSAFRLRLDGASPAGWTTVRIPQVGGAAFAGSDKAYVRVASNQTVSVQFINSLGAAHHVGFYIHGWYWPSSLGS